ncbi:MAG: polymerase, sigma-24 subunit, subfamily [Phycisphaerales bacterium]|nr:polymerase, sigma-24 subunit, subfamily [Phycisphaerales bacterium]
MEPVPDPIDPPGHRNPNAEADAVLVRRTLAGEKQAFDVLVRQYQRPAVAVSYRLLGRTEDALEVVQDALLKAYRSLDTLQKPEAFAGWLMRIVTNLSLNRRRGRKSSSALPLDDMLHSGNLDPEAGGDSPDPQRVLQGKELGERLKIALAQLPEKQRMALELFTIEQLPQKQVAEALECSVEAVKWHVFQARKKLKEALKDVV